MLNHQPSATLAIHGHRIALSDDVDVDALIDEVVTAVRAGGGRVHITALGSVEYDVIVTPSTQALVEHTSTTADARVIDGPWPAHIDLDY